MVKKGGAYPESTERGEEARGATQRVQSGKEGGGGATQRAQSTVRRWGHYPESAEHGEEVRAGLPLECRAW